MNSCDLAIYQGNDWAGWVTVLNCADGTPADLTGYTAYAQIRTGPADFMTPVAAEMLATVVVPNNISLYLSSAQTLLLQSLFYCWDLQLITPSDMIVTLMGGNVNVTAGVTRESQGVLLWDAIPALQLRLRGVSPYQVPRAFPVRRDPRVSRESRVLLGPPAA
jgi:hypothetical protein